MNAHEQIGQLYMENQRLLGEYGKLLDLLGKVCDGAVPTEQVRVDREKLSWAIVPEQEPTPTTPPEVAEE